MKIHYHSDHLGSASFVTNAEGGVMQHLQYLPYGELFVSQRNSDEFDTRYKFTAKELDNETSYTYFGARYYDSELSGWLSVDPMSDERRWVSPYAYCQWNPLILVDPSGMLDDWYRDDETGATFWHEGSENFIEKDGVRYRNIGETHSTYSNGKRIDYKQNNVVNIVDVDPNLNLEGGQYIPQQFTTDNGQKVNVSFSSSSNNAISSDVVSGLIKSINEANNSDANITSINISSTTNHPSNATRSAHTVENGARAIDISRINNVPVSKTDPYSHALQQAIGRVPGWLENYGPSIIQKMYNGAAISAPWAREIKGGHYDHIHYSVPRR